MLGGFGYGHGVRGKAGSRRRTFVVRDGELDLPGVVLDDEGYGSPGLVAGQRIGF
jgi:hypothetical protein